MSPKDRTVIRAVVKALRGQGAEDMDALAVSYPNAQFAAPQKTKIRAAQLLEALANG